MMKRNTGGRPQMAGRLLHTLLLASVLLMVGGLAPPAGHAFTYLVSLDTSGLPAGARLAFDLIGGDDAVDNNSATISGFAPGAALVGGPSCDPAASCGPGSLATSITLTDTEFLNTLIQEIMPGGFVSFSLDVTTNLDLSDSGAPDSFSMAIIDAAGDPLVTTDLFDTALFLLDFDGSSSGSLSRAGSTEPDVSLSVVPAVAIPGPGALLLVGLAFPVILRGRLGRRRA